MGTALLDGIDLVRIAVRHGWVDVGGSKHPYLLKKDGKRPVPIRHKLQNPNEIRAICRQLDLPRDEWPAVVR